MSEQYTPTTEEVRERVAWYTPGEIEDGYAEFDRWLAAHEAEVRERIAQDIEAVPHGHRALYPASHFADIARGATR